MLCTSVAKDTTLAHFDQGGTSMTKGNIAKRSVAQGRIAQGSMARAAILLCATTLASTGARADEAGCAVLAGWVTAGVVAVARDRGLGVAESVNAGAGGRWLPAADGRYTCGATAAVASRAFGEAVRGLNVRLAWNGDWIRPGDYCFSHRLDQCYPSQDPLSPLPPPSEFAFVQQAWASVTRALRSQMPYGTDGDLSSFNDASIVAALSTELRTAVAGTLRDAARDRGPQRR
jgi:hypothetical protein